MSGALTATSIAFALHIILYLPLVVAVLGGAASGLGLISVDRFLVVSLRRRDGLFKGLLKAAPRIILAVLVGVMIATTFTLQIFRPEILARITFIRQEQSTAFENGVTNELLARQIADDRAEVAYLETQASSHRTRAVHRDATVVSLILEREQAAKEAKQAYAEWQCQLYGIGIPGGCIPGNGPLARTSFQRYRYATALVQEDTKKIQSVLRQINSNELADELAATEHALQADHSEQVRRNASFRDKNSGRPSLLLRLDALGDLSSQNSALSAARWLLILFLS